MSCKRSKMLKFAAFYDFQPISEINFLKYDNIQIPNNIYQILDSIVLKNIN